MSNKEYRELKREIISNLQLLKLSEPQIDFILDRIRDAERENEEKA